MSIAILPIGRRVKSRRSLPNRFTLGVELMEGRALMASAAVTSAIAVVQQGQLDQQLQISQEIATLNSNIQSIRSATTTFVYNAKTDILVKRQDAIADPANAAADNAAIALDQKNIKNALRDENFAVAEQNREVKQLQNLSKKVNSYDGGQVKGLNRGKIDPTVATQTSSDYSGYIQGQITTIDTRAAKALAGLISTFDSGTA